VTVYYHNLELCCYYKIHKHQNEQINNYVVKYEKKTTEEPCCLECQDPMEQELESTHVHYQANTPKHDDQEPGQPV